jgi:hypothetical protein
MSQAHKVPSAYTGTAIFTSTQTLSTTTVSSRETHLVFLTSITNKRYPLVKLGDWALSVAQHDIHVGVISRIGLFWTRVELSYLETGDLVTWHITHREVLSWLHIVQPPVRIPTGRPTNRQSATTL